MKKFQLLLAMIFLMTATFAQSYGQDQDAQPRIAVYVTGDFPENEKNALGTRMLAALVKSGHYNAIERSNVFLAKIDEEHVKQRSGAIDDGQISELGKQFGVQFVCIADITPAFGAYQVSARVINVETAEVALIGEAPSRLKSMNDFSKVSDRIVNNMFGKLAWFEPKREAKTKMSVGVGGFFSGDFGGGILWDSQQEHIVMPYSGGGVYLFFDAMYAEVFVGYSSGSGKWESTNVNGLLPDMVRSYINFGAFAKYPVTIEPFRSISLFPLLGAEYEVSIDGRLKYPGGEIWFDGKDDGHGGKRPNDSDLSVLWVKAGGGLDFDLRDIYVRAEFLYGVRTANAFEKNEADIEKINHGQNAKTMLGHGLDLKIGAGFRF